jgi:hypothetical protein
MFSASARNTRQINKSCLSGLTGRLTSVAGLALFAPLKFFLFSGEALFGEYRLSALLQVVYWLLVGAMR